MKKIIILLVAINLSLIVLLAGLYYLAETYPFHPGSPLFGVQSFAENQRIKLTSDPIRQAEMSFELVERRLADLAMVTNAAHLEPAIKAFDRCLTAAIPKIEEIPPEKAETLYQEVRNLTFRADIVLADLEQQVNGEYLIVMRNKFAALQSTVNPVLIPITGATPNMPMGILGKLIPFLGKEVDHGDFPLNGGHADIDCLDCHEDGVYTETPTECGSCHILERELDYSQTYVFNLNMDNHANYPEKYAQDCGECHLVNNWTSLEFDHTNVGTCKSCHKNDLPEQIPVTGLQPVSFSLREYSYEPLSVNADHYPNDDCALCHTNTEDWAEAVFDHYQGDCESCHGFTEETNLHPLGGECLKVESCESCHSYDLHEEEYAGSCTNCHNDVEDWLNIEVDHTEYTNCFDCHVDDRPVEHYKSNCSTCHNTSQWVPAFFDHSPDSTCVSCHAEPVGHYGNECATCHSMETWENGRFPHTFDNCSSCHNSPQNHYPATCTTCHTTQSWHTISIDHTDLVLCTQCHAAPTAHYDGACQNCHDISNWTGAVFNHMGQTECLQCHTAPGGHYEGVCSNCHNTFNWSQINFDHSGLTYCEGCHSSPENHYDGTCSGCHTTTTWSNVIYTHTDNATCSSCHEKEGHWPGQCSRCHITSAWNIYTFDHTGYSDCKACHARPSGHTRGQCSRCHTTDDWTPIPTQVPTLTPTETQPEEPEEKSVPTQLPPTSEVIVPPVSTTAVPIIIPTQPPATAVPTEPVEPTTVPTEMPTPEPPVVSPEPPVEPTPTPGEFPEPPVPVPGL
ncbi:MAG: hypothetical protein CL609_17220 [Anaerolineaceae bacterium]|nr:hypothetical protein [Anaerolineaceae bacterium]